jgi:hypothetical protein
MAILSVPHKAVLSAPLIHSMHRDATKRDGVTKCMGGGQGIALSVETLL